MVSEPDRHSTPVSLYESPQAARHARPEEFLYLACMHEGTGVDEPDFLAVVDLRRDGDRYGTVVATAPVGEKGLWPHHTEHELGAGKRLFANGFSSNRNFLFDLHDPLHPAVIRRFDGVAGLSFLHSFLRLPTGQVAATFQAHGSDNKSPGGIAILDETGQDVRSRSADDG